MRSGDLSAEIRGKNLVMGGSVSMKLDYTEDQTPKRVWKSYISNSDDTKIMLKGIMFYSAFN